MRVCHTCYINERTHQVPTVDPYKMASSRSSYKELESIDRYVSESITCLARSRARPGNMGAILQATSQ